MSGRCVLPDRVFERPDWTMVRKGASRCCICTFAFLMFVCCQPVSGKLTVFVSPAGDDSMEGGREAPLATIEEALTRVRGKADEREIVLLSGIHRVRQPLELRERDSGLPGRPLRIRGEGEVCLSSYLDLPAAGWSKVTEASDLSRLRDSGVGERLMRFRFHDVDRPKLGGMSPRGIAAGRKLGVPPAMLYLADNRMRLARWPNAGNIRVSRVTGGKQGEGRGDNGVAIDQILHIHSTRPDQWRTSAGIWINGFWANSSGWGCARIEKVSAKGKEITIGGHAINRGMAENVDFPGVFFENVFEELDEPYEYFIDEARGLVFFLPPANDLNWASFARLSWSQRPVINIEKARYIEMSGFRVEGTRGDGVVVRDALNIQIGNVTVRNCGGDGLVLDGRDIRVNGVIVEDVGGRGMVIEGGDSVTLKASGNMVINSKLVATGWWSPSWNPAMEMVGVGHQVRDCIFSDLPHMALQFSGNNFLIEGCWFHRACRNPSQMGAVYARLGNDPHMRGTVIRSNLFQDIGCLDEEPGGAIYLADGTAGVSITGNVFHRVGAGEKSQAVIIEGGSHVNVENNSFIDCAVPLGLHFIPSQNRGSGRMASWRNLLTSDATRKHLLRYPALQDFFSEDRSFPNTNTFTGNRISNSRVKLVATKGYFVSGGPEERLKVGDNVLSGALSGISFDSSGRPIIPGRRPWRSVSLAKP